MRTAVAVSLALVGLVGFADRTSAVPSFARVTGLTCNQCHVQFTPNPDFTMTGKKFRMNGYRLPWVYEKMQAGDEGALTGRRLTLNLVNYFSMGFEHTLLAGSKAASDPARPAPEASPISSGTTSNLTTFFSGPISDHIGVWNEIYFTAAGSDEQNPFRLVAHDEVDLKLTWNPGGNIVGFQLTNQPLATTYGFQFSSSAPSHEARGGVAQAHAPRISFSLYGFWKDRLLTVFSLQPGEDNVDWQTADPVTGDLERSTNFQAILGYAFKNRDDGELWYLGWLKAGNDGVPITTNVRINPGSREFSYRDAITGISALRANKLPYGALDMGDFVRTYQQLEYGFIDKGPWSARAAAGISLNRETYADGGKIVDRGVGFTARFNYDRTWEWQFSLNKRLDFTYTDRTGTEHEIPTDLGINARFHRRLAMNFVTFLVVGNSQSLRLNNNWRNGYSWDLGFDYYF
jgi:hypothetical protein